jgi:broad specificity phosphatase PhoE
VKNYLIEPSITEWDLGPLGGAHATTYRKDHPEWSLFDDGPPSPGETTESVIERARYFISNYLQDIGDERIVVFTHGQISKVICMLMLGQHPRYAVTYKIGPARAAILTGDFESGFVLSGWNFSALGTKSSANELLT